MSPYPALAACMALLAGMIVPPSPAVAQARTAACDFVSVDDSPPHAPAIQPPAVPRGATAFTSPDGFGGREYIIGPPNGACVAHSGLDQDFDQQITVPGRHTPAFEQVFGAGGDYQLRYGCRYLPSIRPYADPSTPADCTDPPPTDHVRPVPTGLPTLHAAVVRVESHAEDPQFRTTGTAPVLAVVLAFDLGGDPADPAYRAVTTSFADCRLNSPLCVASLQLFVDEAIAFQHRYVDFEVTGHPGAAIRAALDHYGPRQRQAA